MIRPVWPPLLEEAAAVWLAVGTACVLVEVGASVSVVKIVEPAAFVVLDVICDCEVAVVLRDDDAAVVG